MNRYSIFIAYRDILTLLVFLCLEFCMNLRQFYTYNVGIQLSALTRRMNNVSHRYITLYVLSFACNQILFKIPCTHLFRRGLLCQNIFYIELYH